MRSYIYISCAVLLFLTNPIGAQNAEVWHFGLRSGQIIPNSELVDQSSIHGYAFIRGGLKRYMMLEMGTGYGRYKGVGFDTDVWPTELKVVAQPWSGDRVRPFLYLGTGLVWHHIRQLPLQATPDAKKTGWTPIVPGGFGFQFPLSRLIRLELMAGYTYTYRDDLNGAILEKGNDGFFHWTAGITFGHYIKRRPPKFKPEPTPVPESLDDDKDGLMDRDELNIYHTDPDQSDSDRDGLTDYEEVRIHFTNPNLMDSDGDGLIDSEEVRAYRTNPHIADTDGDGLTDGQEVINYRTDPLKKDTDGDGVSDGDEVLAGRDPLK